MVLVRGRPRRPYCTWESGDVMGRSLLSLDILRTSGIRQNWLTSSHVRTGVLCTWEGALSLTEISFPHDSAARVRSRRKRMCNRGLLGPSRAWESAPQPSLSS